MPDQSVQQVVDTLADVEAEDQVSVAEVVDTVGGRGFGPLLAVPALVSLSPVGAVPGASSAIAVILVLIAAQLVFGRKAPLVPSFIGNRSVQRSRYDETIEKLQRWAPKIDRYVHKRLDRLTTPFAARMAAVATVLVALSFLPVVVIPGGVVAPSLIVLLFGVGLMTRDGYCMFAGWMLCPVWLSMFVWLVLF